MVRLRVALTVVMVVVGAGAPELKFGPTYASFGRAPVEDSDPRLGPLRDLDGHFPFVPSASKEAWRARADALRRQVRVALGLWPWPTRTPLNAVVHGAVTREGYTVERVFFESVPGHFVTGSLYRPTGRSGRLPAVLSPHGHWPGGRFQDVDEAERRAQLASGAERFDNGARHLLQARAVQLARMGTVVFLFDMVGYADSQQIPYAIAHSPRGRTRAGSDQGLFFSIGAELQLNSILGLQIWNAVRALDFLTALPDVDPGRLAVTGASGGGTQTFLLGAIDDRPSVLFPAVMVSARMQGGCTCENADYLRIGTGNVELAALFAPKPLGMTAADDWTKTMPTDGFPELQAHYTLFGARDKVQLFPFLQFDHNYNHVSRTAMYGWLNRHLGLGFDEPVLERDFVPLTKDEATVWDSGHPAPAGGEAHERAVTAWWQTDIDRQLATLRSGNLEGVGIWRDIVGGAVASLLARPVPGPADIEVLRGAGRRLGDPNGGTTTLRVRPSGEQVHVDLLEPQRPGKEVVVWTSALGRSAAATTAGQPVAALQSLLEAGRRIVVVDVFGQGAGVMSNRLVTNRAAAAFTFGYNAPLVIARAHDTLAALQYARTLAGADGRVILVALDGPSSAWAALARAQAGRLVDAAAFATDGFRFASVTTIEDPAFLPGGTKYGDLPALLALAAPGPLWLSGEPPASVAGLKDAYRAAAAPRALTVSKVSGVNVLREAVAWVTKPAK
jgi:dienelactone hydrolase